MIWLLLGFVGAAAIVLIDARSRRVTGGDRAEQDRLAKLRRDGLEARQRVKAGELKEAGMRIDNPGRPWRPAITYVAPAKRKATDAKVLRLRGRA